MLALGQLLCAAAWIQAPSTTSLATRLGLEGPLDNDSDLQRNAEARAELVAGDAAIAQSINETTSRSAFEHWRRALIVSNPLDSVEVDARRSISVAEAVSTRLGDQLKRDFRARFEGVAAQALAAAGANESALERVAYENPHTHSGLLAELRLFDVALERGAVATARAALKRLADGLDPTADDIDAASAMRSRGLPELGAPRASSPGFSSAKTLVLERTLAIGSESRSDTDRMLEPGHALGFEERIWIQSGEQLCLLTPDGPLTLFEPAKLVGEAGDQGAWLPGFGDADRPWLQRPAIAGATLALVLGRARETRGNALGVFDVSSGAPRLRWLRHDDSRADAAWLTGRLEYQPGPLALDGLVIAQVLQWDQGGVSPDQQRVDGRNTHAWLVAFDEHDGRVVWKRRLASGADRRSRALDRFDNPRSTSIASLPLERFRAHEIVACTELGVVARVSALDGRLIESYALKRVRHDAAIRPGSGGPFAQDGSHVAVAPADADEFVYLLGQAAPRVVNMPRLERLVGLASGDLFALVQSDDRSALQRVGFLSPARSTALPLVRGAQWKGGTALEARILIAAGGSVALDSHDARRLSECDLDGLETERHVGVWTSGSRVYVAGEGRIWIVRVE